MSLRRNTTRIGTSLRPPDYGRPARNGTGMGWWRVMGCRAGWSFARVHFPIHARGTRERGPYGWGHGIVGAPLADAPDAGVDA